MHSPTLRAATPGGSRLCTKPSTFSISAQVGHDLGLQGLLNFFEGFGEVTVFARRHPRWRGRYRARAARAAPSRAARRDDPAGIGRHRRRTPADDRRRRCCHGASEVPTLCSPQPSSTTSTVFSVWRSGTASAGAAVCGISGGSKMPVPSPSSTGSSITLLSSSSRMWACSSRAGSCRRRMACCSCGVIVRV